MLLAELRLVLLALISCHVSVKTASLGTANISKTGLNIRRV